MTDITHRSTWQSQRLQGGSERKNNFAKTGEMLLGGGNVTSSGFNKALINDFPLDPKKPATMKYGGSMMDNNAADEFVIDNKNSRKNLKPKLQDDNYQRMNNELNRDLDQLDKTLSQKTKALNQMGNNNNNQDSYYNLYANTNSQAQKDFTKPSFAVKTEKKQELYTSPTGPDDYEDFSPSNIPSRIPKNTLNSTKSKFTQSNNSTAEDFGFQFNKPKLGKNFEDESPTSPAMSKLTFESKLQAQKVPEKPSFAQKEKVTEGLLPKLGSTSKSSINSTASSNFTQDKEKEKEKEKDVDYSKAFSKPSFKKAPTLPAARPEPKKKVATRIPNEDIHQDRGPLKECPHGCGRSFAEDALETHAKVCQKVFKNKREKFQSGQQRVNEDMAKTMTGFGAGAGGKGKNDKADKDGKWKQQSEALRERMKQAKSKEEAAKIQEMKQKEEVGELKACPHGCGRSFNEEAFEKHAKVCQKVFQNKRDKFQSGQQRVNEDMAKTMTGFGAASGKGKADKGGDKDGKWKEQSEALREKLKQAKSKEEVAKIQEMKQKEEVGELKQCPHGCGRSFNEEAFEKHAKICQKVFQNKRDKFESGQQRVNEEMARTMTSGFGAKSDKNKDGGKWKEQSEALRANIKAAAAKGEKK